MVRDAPGKKARVKFIREIIYRDGILRGVQPRRAGVSEKESRRDARVAYFLERTLLPRGAKECLAFDLYSLLKVADAQTSSGTSRIVLAPSAKHARTRILSSMAQRYKTNVASCLQFMCGFHPRHILDPPYQGYLCNGKYVIARKAFR